jgi:hypothetical protein
MRGYNYQGVPIGYTPTGGDRPKLSPGPSSSPPVWNPESDLPAANMKIKVGDRIRYAYPGREPGAETMWDGALVTGIVEEQPYKGQLYVTSPGGDKGIISRREAELLPRNEPELVKVGSVSVSGQPVEDIMQGADGELSLRPQSRSTRVLVGTYELVPIFQDDGEDQYRRLNYTSVKAEVVSSQKLADQLTDALNTVAFMEHDLDPAAVFSVVRADAFEADNEGRII